MRIVKFLFDIFFCLIVCTSCHDKYEWQEFEPFIIKSCSIPLSCDGFTANGKVSSKSTSIDIATDQNPMINSVKLNGESLKLDFYGVPGNTLSEKDNIVVASGEWGTLEYTIHDVAYSINLNLINNDSPIPRVIEISLTGAYRKLDIIITQEAFGNS